MASAPTKTTVVKTVNNVTGVTTSRKTVVSGGSTSTTSTKTIGTKVSAPKKAAVAKKTTTAPAKAAGVLAEDTRWITGPNDTGWTMCGPVAVANHLLAATGVEASNTDMERLYRSAGAIGDSGAPLEFFLAAARHAGLAGERLAAYRRAERASDAGVVLLAVDGLADAHAAAMLPGGRVVLWGAEVDMDGLGARVLAGWTLTWCGA